MQKCLLTLLLCFIGVYARAQYQVSGTVMDQTGETLIGATIREVGDNNNGTITDFNGKYTIKVSKKNAQLSVSYVGYEDQTVSVQGKTIVDCFKNKRTNSGRSCSCGVWHSEKGECHRRDYFC